MSYEGHEVWCCVNGHIHHYNCYDAQSNSSEWKCDHCGGGLYAAGYVDETNGLPYSLRFYIREITKPTNEKIGVYSFIPTTKSWSCSDGRYIFEQWEKPTFNFDETV